MQARLRRAAATRLERPARVGLVRRALAAAWSRLAEPVRRLELPPGARVIGVGGATLGGSGKTPVTLALAQQLARESRVAVVAHGYLSRVRGARVVRPDDRVGDVGDDALMLARALAPSGVTVVVGRRRAESLALAARHAPLVIVDGLLQTAPVPLACAFLVLDGAAPWGAAACPPVGDLRARRERLLRACDAVILMSGASADALAELRACDRPLFEVDSRVTGARAADGRVLSMAELAARRVGLTVAVARPERIERELAAWGVHPAQVRYGADHAGPPEPAPEAGPDAPELWLTTAKCATKLGETPGKSGFWVLDHRVVVPSAVVCLARG